MAESTSVDNPNPNRPASTTPPAPGETFSTFFEKWLEEQNSFLEQLVTAANTYKSKTESEISETESKISETESEISETKSELSKLVERVVQHYEQYYREKSDWEKRDAIAMYTPAWRSHLEDAFLWIGGWRPTLAIHLLYSKSGIQLEEKLGDLVRGITTGDLGDLTPDQIKRVDRLHQTTVHEERVLTEKLAKVQETVADRTMVELSNAVSETMRIGNSGGGGGGGDENEESVKLTLDSKNDEVEKLLHMADDLRLSTLKAVIEVLTPIQAAYFLIAAAELHLRLHEWGKKR